MFVTEIMTLLIARDSASRVVRTFARSLSQDLVGAARSASQELRGFETASNRAAAAQANVVRATAAVDKARLSSAASFDAVKRAALAAAAAQDAILRSDMRMKGLKEGADPNVRARALLQVAAAERQVQLAVIGSAAANRNYRANLSNVAMAQQALVIATERAGEAASKATKGYNTGFSPALRIAAVTTGLFVAGTTAMVAKMGVSFNIMVQQGEIAFGAITKDTNFAKKAMAEFVEMSKTTTFNVGELGKGAQFMLAMGFNTKQVIPAMRTLADATSILGVEGSSSMHRLIYALGQVKTEGVLVANELRQLLDTNLAPYEEIWPTHLVKYDPF